MITDQYSAALQSQSNQLAAIRKARVRAYRNQNPGVSMGDVARYSRQLEDNDRIKLAGLSSQVKDAQQAQEAINNGIDPTTGQRMVDLWGSPVRPGSDSAARIATFQNRPGTRAVDIPSLNQGEVNDWGYQAVTIAHTPRAGTLSQSSNNIIAAEQNASVYDPYLAQLEGEEEFSVRSKKALMDAGYSEAKARSEADTRAIQDRVAAEFLGDELVPKDVPEVSWYPASTQKQARPIKH